MQKSTAQITDVFKKPRVSHVKKLRMDEDEFNKHFDKEFSTYKEKIKKQNEIQYNKHRKKRKGNYKKYNSSCKGKKTRSKLQNEFYERDRDSWNKYQKENRRKRKNKLVINESQMDQFNKLRSALYEICEFPTVGYLFKYCSTDEIKSTYTNIRKITLDAVRGTREFIIDKNVFKLKEDNVDNTQT